jgi:hypothetical protein
VCDISQVSGYILGCVAVVAGSRFRVLGHDPILRSTGSLSPADHRTPSTQLDV